MTQKTYKFIKGKRYRLGNIIEYQEIMKFYIVIGVSLERIG